MPPLHRRVRRGVLLALLGAAGAAHAAQPPAHGIEIVAPRPGATLVAGGEMTIEWRTRGELAPRYEEWEAFLSLDDGATWPVRLTPHLDVTRRRTTVELPAVPTATARLLLRFGDERDERELELPGRLALTPPGPAEALDLRPAPRLALHRGEPARPAAPGVSEWIEGPRDGSASRRVRTAEADGLAAGPRLDEAKAHLAALSESEPQSLRAPSSRPAGWSALSGRPNVSSASDSPPLSAARRLSQLQRWNC